ncbi:hypothetical protein RYX36_010489, partial [Vicia faba]
IPTMYVQEHGFDRDLGFVNTYACTQIQKMQPDAEGKYPYTYSLDCVVITFKAGGPFKCYTKFLIFCVRIAPRVM